MSYISIHKMSKATGVHRNIIKRMVTDGEVKAEATRWGRNNRICVRVEDKDRIIELKPKYHRTEYGVR